MTPNTSFSSLARLTTSEEQEQKAPLSRDQTYASYEKGNEELIEKLVEEHLGWARSIAKSVARAWNLDWQLDGLDGGAYEGLLFCARRYDPNLGVPFRAYARRRIHESSTEEARRSKSWQRGVAGNTNDEGAAREISARLFEIFPELREGLLPAAAESTKNKGENDETFAEDSIRSSIRQLLAGANLIAAFQESVSQNPENAVDVKRMVQHIVGLDPVHQQILWAVYWQGQSMRNLAQEWGIDELSIIREHKELLIFLCDALTKKQQTQPPLKVRRGLHAISLKLREAATASPFASLNMLYLILLASKLVHILSEKSA